MSPFVSILLHAAVLAFAFIGGAFLTFSDFIMRSLSHMDGSGGVEAMQTVNREVFRWIFMALFLGMAAGSVAMIAYGVFNLSEISAKAILLSGLIYLIGCFGVTAAFNVPMNEALAGMDRDAPETRDYWTGTYLPRWTFWNSVRTVACAASAGVLLVGLSLG